MALPAVDCQILLKSPRIVTRSDYSYLRQINEMDGNFMLKYCTVEKCENQPRQKMSFLRKLFGLSGCARLTKNYDNNSKDAAEAVSDDVSVFEDKDYLLPKEDVFAESLSELNYMPGAWRSPSLGKRVVDRVKDSPRMARRAMSKMTSPMVSRRQKEDEIYIVTLHVVHSSGVVGRGDGRFDAW